MAQCIGLGCNTRVHLTIRKVGIIFIESLTDDYCTFSGPRRRLERHPDGEGDHEQEPAARNDDGGSLQPAATHTRSSQVRNHFSRIY